MPIPRMKHFRFWCQSVLPLVYDDSLSYYEVLCKVVHYINDLIDSDKEIVKDIDELKAELAVVQQWIDNYDTSFIEEVVQNYIATMVFFGLTDDGYFVAYIPNGWESITFETTEYDAIVDLMPEFGHLVLRY